ncbi:hypothetical protein J2751_002782 [Halorubrum alkaliphilum]|uniref:Uncharacterized protein n=1 Tax=Halorubrum alkaliphilum TaxID=261290 RepID=A0A8T4GJ73_9EURY|nr:hypothetical protein [Halorubrum alkaliphilum]
MSRVAFRFDLGSDVEDDRWIEIEAILAVPTAALATIPVGPLEKIEHVEAER